METVGAENAMLLIGAIEKQRAVGVRQPIGPIHIEMNKFGGSCRLGENDASAVPAELVTNLNRAKQGVLLACFAEQDV